MGGPDIADEVPGEAGAAADAIRAAESSLARQQSAVAHVDLEVVSAILNAHTVHSEGAGALERLQKDIEAAVGSQTDLDTPAGARALQRYLIDRLRDIRAVVETTDLDSTSKASLAAALASLYASASPEAGPTTVDIPAESASGPAEKNPPRLTGPPAAETVDLSELGLDDAPVVASGDPPAKAAEPPPVATTAAPAVPPATLPSWGGVAPAGLPSEAGLPALSGAGLPGALPAPRVDEDPDRGEVEVPPEEPAVDESTTEADGDTSVVLPDGSTIAAPTPELAEVIRAAVSGTPIPEAFERQGITIPAPGSVVSAPVEPARLTAGDVGVFADRHALALGGGKALLDNSIQPVAGVTGPIFLGWLHPPAPEQAESSTPPAEPTTDQAAPTPALTGVTP